VFYPQIISFSDHGGAVVLYLPIQMLTV